MSRNRYMWVQGNVVNRIDPSGMIDENPNLWNGCQQERPVRNCSCANNATDLMLCLNFGVDLGCSSTPPTCQLLPNAANAVDIANEIMTCANKSSNAVSSSTRGLGGSIYDSSPKELNKGEWQASTVYYDPTNPSKPYLIGVMLRRWVLDNLGEAPKNNYIAVARDQGAIILKIDKALHELGGQHTESAGWQGSFAHLPIGLHFVMQTETSPLQIVFSEAVIDGFNTDPSMPSCDGDQACLARKFFNGPYRGKGAEYPSAGGSYKWSEKQPSN